LKDIKQLSPHKKTAFMASKEYIARGNREAGQQKMTEA
jgi:hypothetical protein